MKSKITGICFLILLFGLTLFSMVKTPAVFSEKENRYLAQKPSFSFSALLQGSFTADYEEYLSDQFPVRDHWIRIQSESEKLLQKKEINGVYLAEDQYLIEQPDRSDFTSDRAAQNVEALSSFIHSQASNLGDSHVQVMIVPSASQILTDLLPPFASPYQEDSFLTSVRQHVGDAHYVDAKNALLSYWQGRQGDANPIYYRTDHHWTTLGAFVGYQSWARAAGLIPQEKEDYAIQTVADDFYGTIQAKVNLPLAADTMEMWSVKPETTAQTNAQTSGEPQANVQQKSASKNSQTGEILSVTYNESDDVRDSLYEWNALETRDKYRFYLNGNQPIVRIQTSAASGRNLLVIKDSFANCFIPFAAPHFEETVVVDLRYFNGDVKSLLERYSITDILVLYQASFLATETSVSRLSLW